ncbi:MAG: FlgD immunoglobulin-like domain containing protein [Candidatus Stygibacter australis]|nr:FlgD immunoglobulin-like domain containing protein [Candidatus Stygibacter australis]
MKKYVFIACFTLMAISAYTCDMAAAVATDEGTLDWSYSPQWHYCTLLNTGLNSCPHDDGRGVTFHNTTPPDDIYSYRVNSGDDLNYYNISEYYTTSTVMLNHARITTDVNHEETAYHPFVWDSRTDSKVYTFMHNGGVTISNLETLLEEGADDDWLNDAFDHLHDNDHNIEISSVNDIIDSEYFFYWLIKNIEANRNILKGLEQALYKLDQIESEHSWRNFMFSDGDDLYIYKRGVIDNEDPDDYEHRIFYGEVVFHPNPYVSEYPGAYLAVTQNVSLDYDGPSVDYFDPIPSANELDDAELVVIESDGTITSYSNFGYYNSDHDYIPEVSYLSVNGVNWKCFPVDYTDLDAQVQLDETEDYVPILYESAQLYYNWNDMQDYDLEYIKGYKLNLSNIGGFGLLQYYLDGVHVLEDHEIPLSSSESRFWIPYFVHGSASVYDAFEEIIDDATFIQGQYWTMSRKNTSSSWTAAIDPGKSLTCYYGKMYDVILATGHPTVMDYYDILGYEELEEYIPPETEYYQYEEELEYEAILIDTIVSNEQIEEVAVYENGECIGASVFMGYPVFIRAFTSELNRSPEPLEFRIFTGGRSEPEVNYRVYDEDFALYRDEDVYPRENVITRVCLGEKGEAMPVMDDTIVHTKQYPDPFNPETAIEYSIPESGNVTIDVYNIRGQKVKSLVSSEQSAGLHKVIWNGTDERGKRAASGMYFYELKYQGQSIREKMLMMK